MYPEHLIDQVVRGKVVNEVLDHFFEDQREFIATQLKQYKDKLKKNPKDKRIRQEIASLMKMANEMGVPV